MERHGPETNTNERSDLKDAQQNWPGLTINPDTAGLIGPAYHCRLPVNESLSSSHHGSLSASSADQSKDQIFDLHDTLYFESTSGRDQFLSVFADLGEGKQLEEPVFAKKDTSSFLKSSKDAFLIFWKCSSSRSPFSNWIIFASCACFPIAGWCSIGGGGGIGFALLSPYSGAAFPTIRISFSSTS